MVFCPTCGESLDKLIEYNGNRICSKCGCVVEAIEKNDGSSKVVTKKKFNKLIPTKIFAVIGIIICAKFLYVILTGFLNFKDVSYLSYLFLSYLFAFISFVLLLFESRLRKKQTVIVQKSLLVGTEALFFIYFCDLLRLANYGCRSLVYILILVSLLLSINFVFFHNKKILSILSMISVGVAFILNLALISVYIEASIITVSLVFANCFYIVYRNDVRKENELNGGT